MQQAANEHSNDDDFGLLRQSLREAENSDNFERYCEWAAGVSANLETQIASSEYFNLYKARSSGATSKGSARAAPAST